MSTTATNITQQIQLWAKELGFQQLGISDTDLSLAETKLNDWLTKGYHGQMDWMQRHGTKRSRPAELEPGTLRIISVRMDYWPGETEDAWEIINNDNKAYISRYALGRDYHKLMRQRLQKLADKITEHCGKHGYRVFVDSAPVMEKPIAVKAGLGWLGKHTNIINRDAGSWFFLGEIYTDMPLEPNKLQSDNHCGTCQSCIEACPTQAIVNPYELDARRCISYLTIEHKGSIPVNLRPHIGNRIYGCDDCQLVCPWNRFAQETKEDDFLARHKLDRTSLLELFSWTKEDFEQNLQGSAIRRIGYESWIRNIAIALGNATTNEEIIVALKQKQDNKSEIIKEHVNWALEQHL